MWLVNSPYVFPFWCFFHHRPSPKGTSLRPRLCGDLAMLERSSNWSWRIFHWIGTLLGNILTGNPWVFTIKLLGLSGSNFPIIQFYEFSTFDDCFPLLMIDIRNFVFPENESRTAWDFFHSTDDPWKVNIFFRKKPRLFAHPNGQKRMDCDKGWPDHVFHSVSEFGESRQVDVS